MNTITAMDFSALLESQDKITDRDVRHFRGEVFGDGVVSQWEAEAMFAIDSTIEDKCNTWNEFFVEALVDHVVYQAEPRGYVSVANAEWLINQISKDGKIQSASELELLVKAIEASLHVPESLSTFALAEVARAVIEGNGPLIGDDNLTSGVIGQPEALLLRRIVYGGASSHGIGISRAEIEVLFDLNDRTSQSENHPEWTDLFVKAMACHLMAASGYQVPDRKEALRREAWLEDTEVDVAASLSKTLSSIGGLFKAATWSEAAMSGNEMENAWAERNADMEMREQLANPVDQSEAEWLAERIGRDGVFHENEKALLKYLKQQSPKIHPALQPLLEKVA